MSLWPFILKSTHREKVDLFIRINKGISDDLSISYERIKALSSEIDRLEKQVAELTPKRDKTTGRFAKKS